MGRFSVISKAAISIISETRYTWRNELKNNHPLAPLLLPSPNLDRDQLLQRRKSMKHFVTPLKSMPTIAAY